MQTSLYDRAHRQPNTPVYMKSIVGLLPFLTARPRALAKRRKCARRWVAVRSTGFRNVNAFFVFSPTGAGRIASQVDHGALHDHLDSLPLELSRRGVVLARDRDDEEGDLDVALAALHHLALQEQQQQQQQKRWMQQHS